MSKRSQIEALLKEGKQKYKEIAATVGTSFRYVCNIAEEIRNGGITPARRRYISTEKYRLVHRRHSKKWKADNSAQKGIIKKRSVDRHQVSTLAAASKKYQPWTSVELEYLREHGKTKTAHQLAVDLKRTYLAILGVASRHGIDLRGDKMGAGSARFINVYESS